MDAEHVRAPRAQKRSQRYCRREAIVDLRRANQFRQKGFAGNTHYQGPIMYAKPVKVREQLEIVLKRFPETDSRIKRNRHGINATLYGARILLSKEISHFRDDIVISRFKLHCLRGPLHMHNDESRFV